MASGKLLLEAIQKLVGDASTAKKPIPKQQVGPGPAAIDSNSVSETMGLSDGASSVIEQIAKQLRETTPPKGIPKLKSVASDRYPAGNKKTKKQLKADQNAIKYNTVNDQYDAGPIDVFDNQTIKTDPNTSASVKAEAQGTGDGVHRPEKNRLPGSIHQKDGMDGLQDLNALPEEEFLKHQNDIQQLLLEDDFLNTLSPSLQKEITEDMLLPKALGEKGTQSKLIYEEGNKAYDFEQELRDTLLGKDSPTKRSFQKFDDSFIQGRASANDPINTTPLKTTPPSLKGQPRAIQQRFLDQNAQSLSQLNDFKRGIAEAKRQAKNTNDVGPLRAQVDRLVKSSRDSSSATRPTENVQPNVVSPESVRFSGQVGKHVGKVNKPQLEELFRTRLSNANNPIENKNQPSLENSLLDMLIRLQQGK